MACVLPGDGSLLEVGVVAASIGGDALEALVDLQNGCDGSGEKLSVVAHDDDGRLSVLDELLEQVQSLGV